MPEELKINPEKVKELLRAIVECKSLAKAHRIAQKTLDGMERRERGEKKKPKEESEDFTHKVCSVCGSNWMFCTCEEGPNIL